jgi:AcrR family transcriptional regulator
MLALMADTLDPATATRRRRADAQRSIDAIVTAARAVLGGRPDASMEDIAAAAGISRQTVYAHFPSRDALIGALIDMAGADALAAIDAAQLDTRPPVEALRAFVDISWQRLDRVPNLLDTALTVHGSPGNDRHQPVTSRLERLIRRGQGTGDFDPTLPATWLAAAVLGLGKTAAEQVAAGRVTAPKAGVLLRDSALRLCCARAPGG